MDGAGSRKNEISVCVFGGRGKILHSKAIPISYPPPTSFLADCIPLVYYLLYEFSGFCMVLLTKDV